jgi:hypothetical protein
MGDGTISYGIHNDSEQHRLEDRGSITGSTECSPNRVYSPYSFQCNGSQVVVPVTGRRVRVIEASIFSEQSAYRRR